MLYQRKRPFVSAVQWEPGVRPDKVGVNRFPFPISVGARQIPPGDGFFADSNHQVFVVTPGDWLVTPFGGHDLFVIPKLEFEMQFEQADPTDEQLIATLAHWTGGQKEHVAAFRRGHVYAFTPAEDWPHAD